MNVLSLAFWLAVLSVSVRRGDALVAGVVGCTTGAAAALVVIEWKEWRCGR